MQVQLGHSYDLHKSRCRRFVAYQEGALNFRWNGQTRALKIADVRILLSCAGPAHDLYYTKFIKCVTSNAPVAQRSGFAPE